MQATDAKITGLLKHTTEQDAFFIAASSPCPRWIYNKNKFNNLKLFYKGRYYLILLYSVIRFTQKNKDNITLQCDPADLLRTHIWTR